MVTLGRGPAPTSVKFRPMRAFPSHAVIGIDRSVGEVHAAGLRVTPHNMSHGIIDQPADPSGAQAQAAQGAGHIVFAAAHPYLQGGSEFDAAMSGRTQAHHAFPQAEQVVTAFGGGGRIGKDMKSPGRGLVLENKGSLCP